MNNKVTKAQRVFIRELREFSRIFNAKTQERKGARRRGQGADHGPRTTDHGTANIRAEHSTFNIQRSILKGGARGGYTIYDIRFGIWDFRFKIPQAKREER